MIFAGPQLFQVCLTCVIANRRAEDGRDGTEICMLAVGGMIAASLEGISVAVGVNVDGTGVNVSVDVALGSTRIVGAWVGVPVDRSSGAASKSSGEMSPFSGGAEVGSTPPAGVGGGKHA